MARGVSSSYCSLVRGMPQLLSRRLLSTHSFRQALGKASRLTMVSPPPPPLPVLPLLPLLLLLMLLPLLQLLPLLPPLLLLWLFLLLL
jgi:hypothetical protein